MGNGSLSRSCELEILDIVDRLRDISGRVEADAATQRILHTPLDMWAAEVRCLRDQETKLLQIVTSLMGTLAVSPESPLGRAAILAADYGANQTAEPIYHNKFHVAEVVLAAYLLGRREGLNNLQVAELLIAATAHDFCHTGTNNQYDYEREMVSVEAAIPLLEKAGLSSLTVQNISKMILATDFKVGVPPARELYKKTRNLALDDPKRIIATQSLLLAEADVLFSCFDLEYNELLSQLLSVEWNTGGPNLPLKARLGFLGFVQFISRSSEDLGIDERRKKLIAKLSDQLVPEPAAAKAG